MRDYHFESFHAPAVRVERITHTVKPDCTAMIGDILGSPT